MLVCMSVLRGYHLPPGFAPAVDIVGRDGIELQIARPDAREWSLIAAACRQAASRLRCRKTGDVMRTLQEVIDRWMASDSPWRKLAEEALPAVTGYSVEMVRHGLAKTLEPLQGEAVELLLDTELGSAGERRQRIAVPPELILHILAGNIPGLAAVPIHLSLALGSGCILKTGTGDPLFASLWAQSIAEIDAELGACLAVTHWPGGDRKVEEVLFGAADVVIASGSEATIASVAARVPRRFCGHGHRISFAVIGKDAVEQHDEALDLARRLAYDVSLWDQQGCLSPQLCYAESGGPIDIEALAEMLGAELDEYARALPPRRLTLEEKNDVRRFRDEAEWTPQARLLASAGSLAWSIALERDSEFRPTCLNRCIRLKPLAALEELPEILRAHRRYLEAAGVAVDERRRSQVAAMLASCGVHRVCRIGKMQEPPLSWRQSGRPRVADWVEWATVED